MSRLGRISKVAVLAVAGSMFFVGCGGDSEQQESANWLQDNGYELTVEDYLLAAEVGDLKAVDLFREHGITVDERDVDTGDTALMRAAGTGEMEAVRHFLSENADVSAVNRSGRPALILAAQEGHSEVVRLLLSHGADLNVKDKDGWNALTAAAYQGRDGVTEVLAGKMLDQLDDALLVASLQGHAEVVDQLLNRGAYVNTRSSADQTPLMLAAKAGHLNVVEMLLRQGANPYALDRNEGTAANLAKRAGHTEVAEFLLHPQDLSPQRIVEATEELNEIADAKKAIDGAVLELPSLVGDLPLSDEMPLSDEVADATGAVPTAVNGDISESATVDPAKVATAAGEVESTVAVADAGDLEVETSNLSVRPASDRGATKMAAAAAAAPVTMEPAPTVREAAVATTATTTVSDARTVAASPPSVDAAAVTVGATNSGPLTPSVPQTTNAETAPQIPATGSVVVAKSPVDGMKMERYRETPLPVMLTNVDDGEAEVRMLAAPASRSSAAVAVVGEEPTRVKVRAGEMIDGTAYRVASVETKFVSSKEGKGEFVDVSQMTVENTQTGEKHLLVKDVPGRSANTYAVVTMQPGDQRYVVHEHDRFTAVNSRAQKEEFQVLEIRPTQVLLENLKTRKVTTVEHEGVAMN